MATGRAEPEHLQAFRSDLRLSARWVAAVLVLLAVAVEIAGEAAGPVTARFGQLDLALILLGTAGAAWLLAGWNAAASGWAIIAGSLLLVYLGSTRLHMSSILVLAWLPVALAAILVGLGAATVAAGCATVLVVGLGRQGNVETNLLGPSLFGVWAAWLVMIGAYLPLYRLRQWLSGYFQDAQRALETARSRKAELEQALSGLRNTNRQLMVANERIAALRLIAEDAEKTKTMFVAKVSHEFRTPLNLIIGLVSVMVESPHIYSMTFPPEFKSDLRVVHRNCQHLSHMINDVLDLTRMRAGRLELRRERVDLADLVRTMVDTVRPLVDKKGLVLSVDLPAGLPRVYCDRTRIQQVILNLVSNAARFTEEGGIDVRVQQHDDRVIFSVADTGPGIAPEDAERIFEPFSQGSSSLWQDKGGAGLGLAVSREFVRRHGGRMWLDSRPGSGATVLFELPISGPAEHVAGPERWLRHDWVWRADAFRAGQTGLTDQARTLRIALWDETGNLQHEFERYSDDVQYVAARDLPELVQALDHCPAHAVVVNAETPAQIWPMLEGARREISDTPLVACSVPRRIERALEAGAAGYLTKPVALEDLREAIDRLGRPIRRVLVVDDEPDVVHLWMRLLLTRWPGLQVIPAYSGRQALEEMRRRVPDLVLLDVFMPTMDGWEVLAKRGQEDRLREIPVILVSGHDPADEPLVSRVLAVTMDRGLSVEQVLKCSMELSALLLSPAGPRPGPERTREDAQASPGTVQHPATAPAPLL